MSTTQGSPSLDDEPSGQKSATYHDLINTEIRSHSKDDPADSFAHLPSEQRAKLVALREKIDSEKHQQEMEDAKHDRALRGQYADRAYKFATKSCKFFAWVLVTHALLFYMPGGSPFSDRFLMALAAAVTVNLFAAFLGVTKGLFPSKK